MSDEPRDSVPNAAPARQRDGPPPSFRRLQGVVAAMLTPLTASGGIDVPALRHIQGVKDSSKSLATLKAFLATLSGRTVLVGTDSLLVDALEAGGAGVVSAVAACFPEVMLDIRRTYASGDVAGARQRQAFANQVRDALKTGPYLHPYKLALRWQGLRFGGMRAPLRECTTAEAETVRLALTRLGLLP